MATAFEKMDKMYRHQRYFYDFTRKYYLLGRDRLIDEMEIKHGENVLEIGCGTGRNLEILAGKFPKSNFYGLDASAAMLETAHTTLNTKCIKNVNLQHALADHYSFDETFKRDAPFDTIFFSYSISMIPTWKQAIQSALKNLKCGRSLYIVDFYDQRDLPNWFRKILQSWLKQFHVKYPRELLPYLGDLEKQGRGKLTVKSIYKSYSFIAGFMKL